MVRFFVFIFPFVIPSLRLELLDIPTLLNVDPDSFRDTCGIVIAKGYKCEVHTVTTKDGYILEMHRMHRPGAAKGPVVFLQHGLEDSSATWIVNMPYQSLGFLAVDQGMDVWMGNSRGNVYSRKHVTYYTSILNILIPSDYWKFTFNEMAKYDLPAMIQYVLDNTEAQNLYFIGHSQGTLIAFVQFSEDPDWAKSRVKQFHALAPVAWLGHTKSPLKLIAPLLDPVGGLVPTVAYTQFTPDTPLAAPLSALTCPSLVKDLVCTNPAMIASGSSMDKENKTRNSVYMANLPTGTSTVNILHFVHLMASGKFETYGPNPVPYHPGTSLVPTYLYWSENDVFTQKEDVDMLKQNVKIAGEHKQNDYDHMDFVWSITAAHDIYEQILNSIQTDFNASS